MDLLDVERELRSHLSTRPVPRAPEGLVERTRVLHRRRRRHQAAAVGAGLAVALLFGSVPVLRAALPDVGRSDAAAPASSTALASLYDLPTRGSLADDEDWLAAVAGLDWQSYGPDSVPGTPRVAWADDVAGERIALVLARDDGDNPVFSWFTGPAGAEPDEMTPSGLAQRTIERQPLAFVDAPPGSSGALVVVAQPGDEITYLAGRDVEGDGEQVDDERAMTVHDGVATSSLDASSSLPLEIRVAHEGQRGSVALSSSERTDSRLVALDDPLGLRSGVSDRAVSAVLWSITSQYGAALDGSTAVLLAAGPLPGTAQEMTLVSLTFPSARTVLWAGLFATDSAGGSTGSTTSALLPAGVPMDDQLVALPVPGGALAVHGPTEGVAAQVLDRDGALLTTVPLQSGSGVGAVPPPAAASVRVVDATGAVVAEGPVTEGDR